MASKKVIGNVKYRGVSRSSHGRYWMQNASEQAIRKAYFAAKN